MRKKLLVILLVFALFLIIVAWFNNNFRLIASRLNLRENPAPVKLTYLINFLGILPVGEAVFAFDKTESFQGKDVYHLNARAENLKVYHFLRKATAVLESYVDQQRLEPVFFRQRFMLSGAQETVKEAAYDQENQVMQIGDVRRQILPGTQDPLSAIFNITKMDFQKIDSFEMNINTNQKNYLLTAKVKKEGDFIILKAEIKRRGSSPYHKTQLKMVLLKGRENIPLLMNVFASGVFINMRLSEAE